MGTCQCRQHAARGIQAHLQISVFVEQGNVTSPQVVQPNPFDFISARVGTRGFRFAHIDDQHAGCAVDRKVGRAKGIRAGDYQGGIFIDTKAVVHAALLGESD